MSDFDEFLEEGTEFLTKLTDWDSFVAYLSTYSYYFYIALGIFGIAFIGLLIYRFASK